MDAQPSEIKPLPLPKWRERIRALNNIPPLLRMVWESAPKAVGSNLVCRILSGLIPLAMLYVTRVIIDSIIAFRSHGIALPRNFWYLIALEFGLASLATILARLIDFCDTVLADKFTRHIGTRIMEHASKLDLTRFEDPTFNDKMMCSPSEGREVTLSAMPSC